MQPNIQTETQSKKVTVEFSGISRMITKHNEWQLQVPETATLSDVVSQLAQTFPGLVGEVIDHDYKKLIDTNVISINGQSIIQSDMLDECPQDGDVLILLSLLAGG